MANPLDELNPVVNEAGKDVSVIEKQLPIKVGVGSKIFEVLLWILGIIPGIIFLVIKINAGKYLSQLEQKIQHDASTIDNYLEQRVGYCSNAILMFLLKSSTCVATWFLSASVNLAPDLAKAI